MLGNGRDFAFLTVGFGHGACKIDEFFKSSPLSGQSVRHLFKAGDAKRLPASG